jgi:3-hydroxypropanoate dehydrogenase
MSDKNHILSDRDLDTLFRKARSYNGWLQKDVSDVLLRALYDLMKFGPTSSNCCPMRVKFVRSEEAKQRLKPHLDEGNVKKTMTAPVTAIIAYDYKFYEYLPRLFPHTDAKSWFEGNRPKIEDTAYKNGTLQGAYLMMAARSLGLDCGPMGGFNRDGVKKEFFGDEDVQVNFICAIGYGDESSIFPRNPRFEFDEVCEII